MVRHGVGKQKLNLFKRLAIDQAAPFSAKALSF
jgi:hypothetical protein